MIFIWTSLPGGVRKSPKNDVWTARVSLVLTPRLATNGNIQTLAEFSAFINWPQTLSELTPDGIQLDLQLRDEEKRIFSIPVRPLRDGDRKPDSVLWSSIFRPETPVREFALPDELQDARGGGDSNINAYDSSELIKEIRNLYSTALDYELKRSDVPAPLHRFAVGPQTVNDDQIINESPMESFSRFHRRADELNVDSLNNSQVGSELATPVQPDFHEVISALHSHPYLLRKLGLIMDFDIPLEQLPLARLSQDSEIAQAAIRLVPRNANFESVQHVIHWTAVDYREGTSERYRLFTVAHEEFEENAGFFNLRNETTIAQENIENAALLLSQQAAVSDESAAELPSLLQSGMCVKNQRIPTITESAIRDQRRLEVTLQARENMRFSGANTANDADDETAETLYAEQLFSGIRPDVKFTDNGVWRSLCQREVTYTAGNWSSPAVGSIIDEGIIEPSVYIDQYAVDKRLRVTDDLFEWDGWSLVVPRPVQGVESEPVLPATALPEGASELSARIGVLAGSLEPQRFGRRYAFRARSVYLAGIGMSSDEADELASDNIGEAVASAPIPCLRVESAKPPVAFRAQNRGYGEAGDIIVLRDADKARYRTREFKLHVLPPEVSLSIAEKHGVFDALSAEESWQLIRQHRGKLGLTEDEEQIEAIEAREFYTPYIPDPMVKQAVLNLPDGAGKVVMPRFDDLPGQVEGKELARSCRLVLRAGQNGIRSRLSGRDVIVELPKGRIYDLEIAARLSSSELSISALAHEDWHVRGLSAAAKDQLAEAAANGEAPTVAPLLRIRVVHATQKPLNSPEFGRPLILPRTLNDTSALLADDALTFDRPSTGRIDISARWEDPVDDELTNGFGVEVHELPAGGVEINLTDGKPFDPNELTEVSRSPLTHDLGDTKHHEVTYTAVARSRFADFYPPELTDDAANITSVSNPVMLHVLSTAAPNAPDIAYLLPTFSSDHSGSPNTTQTREYAIEHRGEGLRVYLERGWFSSGKGEQLALIVASPTSAAPLNDMLSEWGSNPLHDSAPLPGPLELEHIWGGEKRISHWPIEGSSVALVIYDVHFGKEHQRPFIDIEFLSQRAFMPMVRLAFARYQEHAIEDCELSDIVHADFVPLTPGRSITVKQVNRRSWKLDMRGYSYNGQIQDTEEAQTSVVEAQLEYMPKNIVEDAAAWRPIGTGIILRPEVVEPWRYHWSGLIDIEDDDFLSARWRRRLVIQEFEPFEVAGTDSISLANRSRLITAHALHIR